MTTPSARRLLAACLLAAALLGSACSVPALQPAPSPPAAVSAAEAQDSFGRRSADNGYWPTSVQLGVNGTLGRIVVDGAGFTLYRFDQDSAEPSRSVCTGGCLTRWPPVLLNEKITFQNLDPGVLGSLDRADGTRQLTVGGWPAYRFMGDQVPGQTEGQGVDQSWFVLGPDGEKAERGRSES